MRSDSPDLFICSRLCGTRGTMLEISIRRSRDSIYGRWVCAPDFARITSGAIVRDIIHAKTYSQSDLATAEEEIDTAYRRHDRVMDHDKLDEKILEHICNLMHV